MTLPEPCSIAQSRIQSGRGDGARFMKKLARRAVG
jgi:hypothetical protein